MSIKINKDKCTGCPGNKEKPCVHICPGDLIYFSNVKKRPEIRDYGECWGCLSCSKVCKAQAIEGTLPFAIREEEVSLIPMKEKDQLNWYLKANNQKRKIN